MADLQWVEYLARNRAAFDDFVAYFDGLEASYSKMAIKALQANDIEKARRIAGSLDMLSTLRVRVVSWDAEQRAQAAHEK